MDEIVICSICNTNPTTNLDGICDDCKVSILINEDLPPNLEDLGCC